MRLNQQLRRVIVRAIIQDMPKPDYAKRAAEIRKQIDDAMTPEVKRFHKKYPEVCKTDTYVDFANSVTGGYANVFTGDLTDAQVAAILKPYEAEDTARRQAKQQLEKAISGFTTTQQIAKAYPEFAKYLPTDAQLSKNLPALANVVADLAKLGWPKGGVK